MDPAAALSEPCRTVDEAGRPRDVRLDQLQARGFPRLNFGRLVHLLAPAEKVSGTVAAVAVAVAAAVASAAARAAKAAAATAAVEVRSAAAAEAAAAAEVTVPQKPAA